MFTNSSQSLTEGGSNQLETMPYEEKVIGWNIDTPPPLPFAPVGAKEFILIIHLVKILILT